MALVLGEGYWTYDDGTADIYTNGTIGKTRYSWANGVRNNITALYTTGYLQRTPSTPFILSVYRYGEWVEVSRNTPRSYYSWVQWSFWIQGYYNRWFKVSFAGQETLFSVGTITDPEFIPEGLTEPGEPESTWQTAIQNVKSLISDVVERVRTESLRVDIEFETYKRNLDDSLVKQSTDTEKLINQGNDSILKQMKTVLSDDVKLINADITNVWNVIEGVGERFTAVTDSVNQLLAFAVQISDSIHGRAIDAVILYAWYIIDKILDSELKEQEVNENGRNINRDD